MARVVNVKVAFIRPKYTDLQEWTKDENNVYIGRAGIVFVKVKNNGEDAKERFPKKNSKWANPYKVGKNLSREEALEKYEIYIREKIETGEISKEEILELSGKNLGCWCKPDGCHGDILVKLIKEFSV